MGTILTIIGVVAVIGAVIGFLVGGSSEDAAAGAKAGAVGATGCMFQLMIAAIPVAIGLWLLSLIF